MGWNAGSPYKAGSYPEWKPGSPFTTGSDPELVFRRARPADYEAVLAMGDMFHGLDYMPHMYHRLLANPDYKCFVCEADGKVVSYSLLLSPAFR